MAAEFRSDASVTFTAITAVLVATACGAGAPPGDPTALLDPLSGVATPIRRVDPGSWDTAFVIGGTAEDTLLLMPRTLGTGRGWFAAFDYGDNRVKRFDTAGALQWASGGSGEGPGEFRGNFGLQSGPENILWAADPSLARLTALDDTGGVVTSIPLGVERPAGVAVVAGNPIVLSSNRLTALIELAEDGVIIARYPPPIERLADLPEFARSVVVASNGGRLWAVAYPYGNLLVVYDGTAVRCVGKLVTGRAFPVAPVRKPVFSISAITLVDTTVVALGNGGGEGRNRHLDRYSLSDCGYLGSLPLPNRYAALAHDGSHCVLAAQDSIPLLIGLRWLPAER